MVQEHRRQGEAAATRIQAAARGWHARQAVWPVGPPLNRSVLCGAGTVQQIACIARVGFFILCARASCRPEIRAQLRIWAARRHPPSILPTRIETWYSSTRVLAPANDLEVDETNEVMEVDEWFEVP